MSKSTLDEHKALRDRLNPIINDEFVQPVKLSSTRLERKERLDDLAEQDELNKIFKECYAYE